MAPKRTPAELAALIPKLGMDKAAELVSDLVNQGYDETDLWNGKATLATAKQTAA
jgi:hypothetical protein